MRKQKHQRELKGLGNPSDKVLLEPIAMAQNLQVKPI